MNWDGTGVVQSESHASGTEECPATSQLLGSLEPRLPLLQSEWFERLGAFSFLCRSLLGWVFTKRSTPLGVFFQNGMVATALCKVADRIHGQTYGLGVCGLTERLLIISLWSPNVF